MRVVLTILQNDCMLIFGRGDDGRGNLIDGKSLYLLETLPGMKFRGLKRKTKDEARGLASACLYLNLKLDHQYEGDQDRDLLKTIMRERYQHRFTDFTCLIQRRDAGINWKEAALFGCGRYGSTYGVPWTVGRRYDTLGNVCYNRYETGIVLIKIMANSEGESRVARDDMFCNRVSTPHSPGVQVLNSGFLASLLARILLRLRCRQPLQERCPLLRLHVCPHQDADWRHGRTAGPLQTRCEIPPWRPGLCVCV